MKNSSIVVRDEIRVAVAKAARNGGIMRSTDEATKILGRHPDSGMTLSEIGGELFRQAIERRLAVEY